MFGHLSVRSKLLATVLGVSIGSMLVVSVLSFQRGRQSINDLVTENLVAQRAARAEQIEEYMRSIESQAATLSQDRSIATAMVEFTVSAEQLAGEQPNPEWDVSAVSYYNQFIAGLPAEAQGITASQLVPKDPVARQLQQFYLVTDPGSVRQELEAAEDSTFYSRVHTRFHPSLQTIAEQFGFDDLYLIEPDDRRIVYSVAKGVDFGTSLISGPWGRSSLAGAVADVLRNPVPGTIVFTDFDFYRPSLDQPTAFVAAPVFNNVDQRLAGVLAFQLSLGPINAAMTADGDWADAGFGRTGEAYLVGPDLMMRSQSRLLAEDPQAFAETVSGRTAPTRDVELMVASGTAALRQPVRTAAAQRALLGETGTDTIQTYTGSETLASYGPLDLPSGLNWAIVAEQALDEAQRPTRDHQRELLVATGAVVLILTVLSMFLSARFVRPLDALRIWTGRVGEGDFNDPVPLTRYDEIGELAASVDDMVQNMRRQASTIDDQRSQMQSLILNLMPPQIAERVSRGETAVADEYPDVTIVVATLSGFNRFTRAASPGEGKELLDEVIGSFDEVAEELGIEKIKGTSSRYVAACGLLEPRLDQRQRAMQFAVAIDNKLQALSKFNQWDLELRLGVASGDVEAGLIGRRQISFEVWGQPVALAGALADAAAPGSVLVDKDIAAALSERYRFVPARPVVIDGRTIDAWRWVEGV